MYESSITCTVNEGVDELSVDNADVGLTRVRFEAIISARNRSEQTFHALFIPAPFG